MTFTDFYVTEGLKDKLRHAFLASCLAASVAMGSIDPQTLYKQISKHEGVREQVYKDIAGHLTIGIGFNLDDLDNRRVLSKMGITLDDLIKGRRLTPIEIKALYNVSITKAWNDAKAFLPNLTSYPVQVQQVIVDMAFNMGRAKLMQFAKFKAALLKHDYKTASVEMLNSAWAKQTKSRATELAAMMRSFSTPVNK